MPIHAHIMYVEDTRIIYVEDTRMHTPAHIVYVAGMSLVRKLESQMVLEVEMVLRVGWFLRERMSLVRRLESQMVLEVSLEI